MSVHVHIHMISVGLGPVRASPRAFFTARSETGPGRAVKNPARAGTARGLGYGKLRKNYGI